MRTAEHECIIGMIQNYRESNLVTKQELFESVLEFWNLCKSEPHMFLFCEPLTVSQYLDGRRSTNFTRFAYCPFCGKEIDWKQIKKEAKDYDTNT